MKELKIEIPEGYEIDKENSTFKKIVFKPLKDIYPKTWEECIKKLNNIIPKYYWIGHDGIISNVNGPITYPTSVDYNLLPSKEIAEKFLILQKLYTCRQAYIDDWKPNWNSYNEQKYVIKTVENNLTISTHHNEVRSFSFPTFEMATEFLKNFKNDLEKIKDLL